MPVVVTGATGHVGNNLVRELLRRGVEVRALIHRNERPLDGLPVERVRGDVRDPDSLRKAFAGADLVYHLVGRISITGEQGGLVRAINVDGVRNAAEAALACGVRRFVHFSSIHAFMQEPLDQPLDETRERVTTPKYPAYDRSKAAGEAAVREVVKKGLDAVIVHPSGVIGPFDFEPSRMGRVFLRMYHGKFPALIPGGFTWVDVRDVVLGAIAAGERGRTSESYLLTGHWNSVAELGALVERTTGVRTAKVTVPMWLARAAAPVAVAVGGATGTEPLFTGESLHALRANRDVRHDKAKSELGHTPRPMEESVRDIFAWFGGAGLLRDWNAVAAAIAAGQAASV